MRESMPFHSNALPNTVDCNEIVYFCVDKMQIRKIRRKRNTIGRSIDNNNVNSHKYRIDKSQKYLSFKSRTTTERMTNINKKCYYPLAMFSSKLLREISGDNANTEHDRRGHTRFFIDRNLIMIEMKRTNKKLTSDERVPTTFRYSCDKQNSYTVR